jgi:rubrerythrin
MPRPGGDSTENYCRKCGYVPKPNSHDFKCPACGYDAKTYGWGIRLKKRAGS